MRSDPTSLARSPDSPRFSCCRAYRNTRSTARSPRSCLRRRDFPRPEYSSWIWGGSRRGLRGGLAPAYLVLLSKEERRSWPDNRAPGLSRPTSAFGTSLGSFTRRLAPHGPELSRSAGPGLLPGCSVRRSPDQGRRVPWSSLSIRSRLARLSSSAHLGANGAPE